MVRSRLVAEVRAWCFTRREVGIKSLWAFQRYKCTGHPCEGMEEMMGGFDQTHGKDLQEQVSATSSWMSKNAENLTPLYYPEPMLRHIKPSKKKKGNLCRAEDKKLRAHVDASLNPSIDMQNRVSLLEENLSKMLEEIKLSSQGKEILIIEKLEMLQNLDEKVQKIDENVEKLGATGLIDVTNMRDQEMQSRLKRLEECAFSSKHLRVQEMESWLKWREEFGFLSADFSKALFRIKTFADAIDTQQTYPFKRVLEEVKCLQDGMTTMEQHLSQAGKATNTQQMDSFERVWDEMKRLQDGMTTILQDLRGGVDAIDIQQVHLFGKICEELKRLQDGITTIEQVRLLNDVKGKDRADVVLVAISSVLLACSTAMCAWTLHF